MSSARYGGFTVRVDCRACGQPIPVNAPEPSVHCDHCQSDAELPREVWRAILHDFDEDYGRFDAVKSVATTMELGGWIAHAARRRAIPACEKCSAPYPADRISDQSTRDFFCVACGDPASTYSRPAWLSAAASTAVQIILTEPRGPGAHGEAVAVPDAARPVLMQCPGCGAPLSVTASSPRTVRCDHCRVDVYLPDDLWRRLHPAKTMREWFVRFEGVTDKERASTERHAAQMREGAARDERAAREREASARQAIEARAHAEADAKAHEEAVQRAKRNAYLALVPLYATIATVLGAIVVSDALDLELPPAAFIVAGGFQLVAAGIAAFATAKPIKTTLRADSSTMMAYHWIWVIFSMFVFPFGPIVFFVGLKRFIGSFAASTLKDGSGYHSISAATLTKRESWPAAFFFLAMSLGVASEIATAIYYSQDQHAPSQTSNPPGRSR